MNVLSRLTSKLQPFRVCMWHTGRCGSSVIADLVSRDRQIHWAGEVLERVSHEWGHMPPPAALASCRRKIRQEIHRAGRAPFGFEMKLWHHQRLGLTDGDMHDLVTGLGFGLHVVLERKNHLRQHVSSELAKLTGQFHRREGSKASEATVTVDTGRLLRGCTSSTEYHAALRDMLPGHLYLTYEDDIEADPTVAYDKIMRYCGLTPREPKTDMRKTNPRPMESVIENWDEVVHALSGTPHEWMLTVAQARERVT